MYNSDHENNLKSQKSKKLAKYSKYKQTNLGKVNKQPYTNFCLQCSLPNSELLKSRMDEICTLVDQLQTKITNHYNYEADGVGKPIFNILN